MRTENVCNTCPLNKTCPDKRYASCETAKKVWYVNCMKFTCEYNGMSAAYTAMIYGELTEVEIGEELILACRFGTPTKPTHEVDQEFERLVTPTGKIIVKTSDQKYSYNGQNVADVFPNASKRKDLFNKWGSLSI